MTVHIDTTWIVVTLLVATRIAGATLFTPVFGPTRMPATVRVGLVLALAAFMAALAPPLSAPAVDSLRSLPGLAVACTLELLIGSTFACGLLVAYGATQVAGRILDFQVGFGAANVYDPSTRGFSPLIGTILGMTAIAVFLALDGHHALIRALALSLQTMPPGGAFGAMPWSIALERSGVLFVMGLALAAPVMSALLLADIAIGVAARSLPQLNVFMLSLPLKVVLGVIGLAAALRFNAALFGALWESTARTWSDIAVAGSR